MQKRMNLTKTIRKLPVNEDGRRTGYYVHDDLSSVDIKYDEPPVRMHVCVVPDNPSIECNAQRGVKMRIAQIFHAS